MDTNLRTSVRKLPKQTLFNPCGETQIKKKRSRGGLCVCKENTQEKVQKHFEPASSRTEDDSTACETKTYIDMIIFELIWDTRLLMIINWK